MGRNQILPSLDSLYLQNTGFYHAGITSQIIMHYYLHIQTSLYSAVHCRQLCTTICIYRLHYILLYIVDNYALLHIQTSLYAPVHCTLYYIVYISMHYCIYIRRTFIIYFCTLYTEDNYAILHIQQTDLHDTLHGVHCTLFFTVYTSIHYCIYRLH